MVCRMLKIIRNIQFFLNTEDGATAIEYGLIAAAIAIAIIAAVFSVGNDLSGLFDMLGSQIGIAGAP